MLIWRNVLCNSVLFTNAFVTTAICCSNRACILTGQHMRRHAIRDFRTPLSAEAFAGTYPALLRKAGYRTGYLGKFAVGSPQPEILHLSLPAEKFDFWLGFPQAINFRQEANAHAIAEAMRRVPTIAGMTATLRCRPARLPPIRSHL